MTRLATPLKSLLSEANRGLLLDGIVFGANLLMLPRLSIYLGTLFQTADTNTQSALRLGLFFLAALLLPVAGATLKRWHVHQRHTLSLKGLGCLFSPLFYFPLTLVITSGVLALLVGSILGKSYTERGAVFVSLTVLGLVVSVIQTIFVYRYFQPPKKAPTYRFLRSPSSALLGDMCIYLNMMLFQIVWNFLSRVPFGPVAGLEDFLGRLFYLSFVSLLVYFPPRMFYLAEDRHRPTTWVSIALANFPTVVRVLFGST
jgi:hypothetical protein